MSTSISPPLSRDARGPVDIACRPGAVAETQTETETFRRHCGIIADLAPAYRARGMDQEVFEWVACAALRQAIRTFTGDSRDFPAYATTAIVTRARQHLRRDLGGRCDPRLQRGCAGLVEPSV